MYNQIILISVGLVVLCLSIHQVSSSKKKFHQILDDKPSKGKTVLKFLCDPPKVHDKQISRLSTITWLHDQFKSNATSGKNKGFSTKQMTCLDKHKDVIDSLYNVITISNDDICSQKKVSAVESFHKRYIVDSITRKHRPGHGVTHEPLLLFFMHYASELTIICRRHLLANLQLVGNKTEHDYESIFKSSSSMSRLIEGMHKYLGSPDSMLDFDDFVLIWNMIEDYRKRKDKSSLSSLSSSTTSTSSESLSIFGDSTDGRFEPMVKVKSLGDASALQNKCLYELKPIYAKVTLPLMRLIDLGYYRRGDSSQKDLKNNRKQVRNWYGVTQACEALLAIKIYQDDSLQSDEVVLITKEEAKQLEAKMKKKKKDQVKKEVKFSVKKHNFGKDDTLRTVRVDKARKMVKAIKSNLKARNRVFKKILIRLAADLKGQLKNRVKHFFISKKSDTSTGNGNKFVKENAEPLISSSLTKAQKFMQDQSDSLESLNRRKRCVTIVIAILAIIAIIVLVVLVILVIFLVG